MPTPNDTTMTTALAAPPAAANPATVAAAAATPNYQPQPFGLRNTGAICHLNSLLQSLVSCPVVVKTVMTNRAHQAKTATGRAFYDYIYAAVPTARPPDGETFAAGVELRNCSAQVLRALVTDLRARRPQCRYGPSQESASEGLVLLLDMMNDPKDDPKTLDGAAKTERERVLERGGAPPPPCGENPVAKLFYHTCRATVYCCTCKAAVSTESDVAVQLDLFNYDSLAEKPSTPEAFSMLTRSQVSALEGYRCEKCGITANGVRHYQLCKIPEILVLSFNVYQRTRATRYTPPELQYPAGGRSLVYKKVAQVEHFGSCAGGHYIARALRADGVVYTFNDSSAEASALTPNPNVYLTFYHRTVSDA
jgi:ubiquitin C-terminal hydrolase